VRESIYNIFQAIPVPMIIVTFPEWRYVDVNNECLKMLGYEREEIVGMRAEEVSVLRDPGDHKRIRNRILERGRLREEVLCIRTKYGETKETLWSGEIIKINNEYVLLSLFYDITESKRTENDLRSAQELYRDVATHSLTAFYIAQDGKIRFTNPYLCRYSGYSEKDLLEMDILSFVHPDDRAMVREQAIKMLKGESKVPYEYRIMDKNGRIRWVMETVTTIKYEGRRATLGSTMDITERKKIEDELKDAKDMLLQSEKLAAIGKLSAGVAHEILNPLNILSMRLQILEMMEPLSGDGMEALKICKVQIERIVKITRGMSQFSRITTRHRDLWNLNHIIEYIINLSRPRLKLEDVRVNLDMYSDMPSIQVDKFRIEQVILNLLNNAIDAMNGKSAKILNVTTTVDSRGGREIAKVIFSDTGAGIKPENMDRLFEPFFTTKDPDKGTGLGLSICFGIVQDHDGTIRAENNKEGGATFIIELPCP
jgi:two-component system NtrC family sensor kinase